MTGVYIATKRVFALMVSVWCVHVGHSPHAQCTKNVHPLVLSVFFLDFFRKPPTACRTPSKRETKEKPALTR